MGKLSYRLSLMSGLALLSLSGSAVYAVNSHATAHAEENIGADNMHATTAKDAAASRLTDAKLKACHKREIAVGNIMKRIDDRAVKQSAVFDKIAVRTEAFYIAKGKTVAGYDALVAKVDAAKAKVATDSAALKTESNFSCDGTDPKGMVASFKSALKTEISDLKAYRTAVKNLIVAVKSAQVKTQSESKASPSTSASPSPSMGVSPSASPAKTEANK